MNPENPVAAATHSTGPHERCPRALFLTFDGPSPGVMFWNPPTEEVDVVSNPAAAPAYAEHFGEVPNQPVKVKTIRMRCVGFGSVPNLWDSRAGAHRVLFVVLAAGYPFTSHDRRWSASDGVMLGEFGPLEQHVRLGVEGLARTLNTTPQVLVATAHDFWFYGK